MTNDERLLIYKDLSYNLQANLSIHLKKMIRLFQIIVCHTPVENIEKL